MNRCKWSFSFPLAALNFHCFTIEVGKCCLSAQLFKCNDDCFMLFHNLGSSAYDANQNSCPKTQRSSYVQIGNVILLARFFTFPTTTVYSGVLNKENKLIL